MIGPVHFINNKYFRWYNSLLERAVDRSYDSRIHENHHSYPRSFGGTKHPCLPLTFREHFLCHWLLTKFTVGKAKAKMHYALLSFCLARTDGRRELIKNSWRYSIAREAIRDQKESAETRAKKSQMRMGKKHSEETKAKIGKAHKGKKVSYEWRKSHSDRQKGKGAKTYKVIDPNGNIQIVTNLTQFSLNNQLDQSCMANVARGSRKTHKGWIVQRVEA